MATLRNALTGLGSRSLAVMLMALVLGLCFPTAGHAASSESDCPGFGPVQQLSTLSIAPDPVAVASAGLPAAQQSQSSTARVSPLAIEPAPVQHRPGPLTPRAPPLHLD